MNQYLCYYQGHFIIFSWKNESSTLLPVEIPLGKNSGQQSFQPSSPSSRPQNTIVLTLKSWACIIYVSTPRTPAAIAELSLLSFEKLAINFVKNSVIFLELPGKGAVAQNNAPIIFKSKGPRVLLGRIIPCDVVEIMINCSVLVVFRIAYSCLEVSLRRWDKVGVVKEKDPWQIVPPHNAILGERSWKDCPCWTLCGGSQQKEINSIYQVKQKYKNSESPPDKLST